MAQCSPQTLKFPSNVFNSMRRNSPADQFKYQIHQSIDRVIMLFPSEPQKLRQCLPLDGFETLSPNPRALGAQGFTTVEMKLGHTVRPGKRGRKPHGGRMD